MSYVVREVAKFVKSDRIEIVKQLNHESLDGITEWSHCWLVLVVGNQIQMIPCEILDIVNLRQLRLNFLHPLPPGEIKIIDIKPVHPCDLEKVDDVGQFKDIR